MAALLLGEAVAQPPPVDAEQKTVRIQRTAEPPTIDGDLSEELWVRAPPVADFHQVTPVEGDAPSERTEVYVLYDRDALYIGVRLFDAEPELINARILRQGQSDRRRRPLFRPSRPIQQPSQRLPIRRQPERRALRRHLRGRDAAAVRLGRNLAGGRTRHTRGLGARDGDPVQDTVVRSGSDELAHEFRAQHRTQERGNGLDLAQSQHRSLDDGRRDRYLANRAGPRPRRRPFRERARPPRDRHHRGSRPPSRRWTCSTSSPRSSMPHSR